MLLGSSNKNHHFRGHHSLCSTSISIDESNRRVDLRTFPHRDPQPDYPYPVNYSLLPLLSSGPERKQLFPSKAKKHRTGPKIRFLPCLFSLNTTESVGNVAWIILLTTDASSSAFKDSSAAAE
jgi:hypothetical protein